MGWIKWVGGGIAASLIGAAILFGVFVTGGCAAAQESDDPGFDTPLGGGGVLPLVGPGNEEYLTLVASKLGVSVDELKAAFQEARAELGLPDRSERPHRPFRNGAFFGWNLRGALDAVSDLTGASVQDILAGFREGKTLAQIGEDNGVSKADLKAGIVAAVTAKLGQALENARLSQERYDEIVANLNARIDELLDKVHTGPAGMTTP